MQIIELGKGNSIFNVFLSQLRDQEIQIDSMRFRKNMERVSEIFAYEISKHLEYENKEVKTSLGIAKMQVLKNPPVLATILRAGLAMHQGLLNYFDGSDSAFVSAYRKYKKNESFSIEVDYMSSTCLDEKVLIVSDPMLATGGSMVASIKALLEHGSPSEIHIVTLLSCEEGIAYVKKHLSLHKITLWTGAIDDELTAKAYIVPGLGDAGDLAYGEKID